MQIYEQANIQAAHHETFVAGRQSLPAQLPPKTTREEFDTILNSLRQIVGDSAVVVGHDLLNFCDPFSPHGQRTPSAAVCPASATQVQQVVKLVNAHRIPIWAVSRGKNLGYGGAAPIVSGSIVLSLHRMTNVLEVNEKDCYAVVEPGVSFYQLSNHCLDKHHAVWPNTPLISWGSVVGNALDRGIGYNAVGDHHHHIWGMEVVLPDGDIVRTGQWAANDAASRFVCKNSFGPSLEGLFIQSNLGIVTKLAVGLQPRPSAYMADTIDVATFPEISPFLDALGCLRREDIIQNDPLLSNVVAIVATLLRKSDHQKEPGPVTDETMEKLSKAFGCGWWSALLDFYGSKEMVSARWHRLEEVFQQYCPTAKLSNQYFEASDDEPLNARDVAKVTNRGFTIGVGEISSTSMMKFCNPPDFAGHIAHSDFVPIMPHDGPFLLKWLNEARPIIEGHGFDFFLGGHLFKKHYYAVHMFYYDSDSEDDFRRLRDLWAALLKLSSKYHLVPYRAHQEYMDTAQELFDFNNHSYRRLVTKIKGFMDPNGIFASGKQGIWPEKNGASVL